MGPSAGHSLLIESRAKDRDVCWGEKSQARLQGATQGKALLAVVHCGDLVLEDFRGL